MGPYLQTTFKNIVFLKNGHLFRICSVSHFDINISTSISIREIRLMFMSKCEPALNELKILFLVLVTELRSFEYQLDREICKKVAISSIYNANLIQLACKRKHITKIIRKETSGMLISVREFQNLLFFEKNVSVRIERNFR